MFVAVKVLAVAKAPVTLASNQTPAVAAGVPVILVA